MANNSLIYYYFLWTIGVLCCFQTSALAQKEGLQRIDSLSSSLAHVKNDSARILTLIDLSYSYYPIDPRKGLSYGEKAKQLAQQISWADQEAWADARIGVNYEVMGELPSALSNDLAALQIFEKIGDKKGNARTLGNVALVYEDKGDLIKALNYNLQALKLNAQISDRKMWAGNLNNIGEIYKELGNYQKADNFYSKALIIKTELSDRKGQAIIFNNLGEIEMQQKQLLQAAGNFKNSIALNRQLGNRDNLAINLSNLGEVYKEVASEDKNIIKQEFKFADKRHALQKAELLTDSAISLYIVSNSLNDLLITYKQKSELQQLLGNFKGSLISYQNYIKTKDSVINMNKAKSMDEMEQRYINEKAKLSIERKKEADERKEHIQIAGIASIILLLIPGILILSKMHINLRLLSNLSTFSVIALFEFLTLLIHPQIEAMTGHNVTLTLLCLVGIASIVLPMHHHMEEWLKRKLSRNIKITPPQKKTRNGNKKIPTAHQSLIKDE